MCSKIELIRSHSCIKVALDNDTQIVEPDPQQDDDMEMAHARMNVTRTMSPLITGYASRLLRRDIQHRDGHM